MVVTTLRKFIFQALCSITKLYSIETNLTAMSPFQNKSARRMVFTISFLQK